MNRQFFGDAIVAIICVDFLNTLLLIRVANMDNGNIARHKLFLYPMAFCYKRVEKERLIFCRCCCSLCTACFKIFIRVFSFPCCSVLFRAMAHAIWQFTSDSCACSCNFDSRCFGCLCCSYIVLFIAL